MGPRVHRQLLVARARMEGFLIFDYRDRLPEAREALAGWLREGKLRCGSTSSTARGGDGRDRHALSRREYRQADRGGVKLISHCAVADRMAEGLCRIADASPCTTLTPKNRDNSGVEQEVQDVAVLHLVALALDPHLARVLGGLFAAEATKSS
jgi:hypothetical protein